MASEHPGAFARHGWWFRRGSDASVTIWTADGDVEVTFTPQVWASIVAAVSEHGEGNDAYRSAFNFHVDRDL